MKNILKDRFIKLKHKIGKFVSEGNVGHAVLIAYTLIVLVPTAMLLYLYYHHTAKTTSEEIIHTMFGIVSQARTNMSYRMDNIKRISDLMFIDPTLNKALKTDPKKQTVFGQKQEHDAILRMIETLSDTEGVSDIKIYIKTPKLYRNEGCNFFTFEQAKNQPWFDGASRAEGAIYWYGSREVTDSNGTPERVLTCARMLIDLDHIDRVIGAMIIEVREQMFLDIVNEVDFSDEAEISIMTSGGQTVMGKGNTAADADTLTEGINKTKDGYLLLSPMTYSDWNLTAFVPYGRELQQNARDIRFFGVAVLMILFALFMLAFLMMFGYIVLRVNRRIHRIATKIETEGVLYGDDKNEPEPGDNFYYLENQVDVMIGNIRELMQRSYSAEIEKKDAELSMLQSQINPHFLYNTLNSISWTAIKTGATEVNEMIGLLSQYFRLSLSGGKAVVRVQDEINLARVYLEIQNIRFMNMIDINFDVDDDILNEEMPKLTLQPILENAVLHGLQYKNDKNWKISVSARREGDFAEFCISDNGVGMTQEQLERLTDSLSRERDKNSKTGGFGLYNVYRRLELRYGDKNSLKITSKRGVGTKVVIRILVNRGV